MLKVLTEIRRLFSTKGVFAVLVLFWCSFVFVRHQRNNVDLADSKNLLEKDICCRVFCRLREPPIWTDTVRHLSSVHTEFLYPESDDAVVGFLNLLWSCPSRQSQIVQMKNCREPFVVRGFAREWPALYKWDFEWVHDINVSADVLTSASLRFMFYKVSEGERILQTEGPSRLPAVMSSMTTREAVQRMMISSESRFENLYYNKENRSREYYYIRFDLTEGLYHEVRLTDGMLRCRESTSSDQPRLWVSVMGSVSPMHWDGQYSCLVQLHGTKRMLFYSPEHINMFGTYPKSHLLWRRSKFDPANPNYSRFPDAKEVGGTLAVVNEGDAVCFPPRWLHYTDSLTHSISLTMRGEKSISSHSKCILFWEYRRLQKTMHEDNHPHWKK